MTTFSHNPENALKRSNEFLELGKCKDAIGCLYDVLKNRKNKVLKGSDEEVINKLLEICVENKISQPAKDGLYLYRILCQNVNIKSLEDVIKRFLALAEARLERARVECATSISDFATLEQEEMSGSLLKYVTSEDHGDRTNRLMLIPWVRFVWECYRFCLEFFRNTPTEKMYHFIARSALKFCIECSRKTELRKICNQLKIHLDHFNKRQGVMLENHEIQLLFLETGMVELDTAVHFELWQEAFKAIEYIHLVLSMMRKPLPSRALGIYYEKLSLVFWKANDLLYHSAALFRYFLFSRELKKNFSTCDAARMSSRVVLAVLSVPFAPSNPVIDLIADSDENTVIKKHKLLCTILDFPFNATRKSLIKDLERNNVIQCASPEVQELFQLIETKVDPLNLKSQLISVTKSIEKKQDVLLSQYVPHIYDFSTMRILSQLSQIYKNISFQNLMKRVPIDDNFYIEKLAVEAARRYNIPIRIDHINQCMHFSSVCNLFQRCHSLEGPEDEILPADRSLNYLTQVHSTLKTLAVCVEGNDSSAQDVAVKGQITEEYLRNRHAHRREFLDRKEKIRKFKDALEQMKLKREEIERKTVVNQQLKFEAAEKERLVKEAKERAAQQHLRQQEEIKKQIFLEKVETLKKSDFGNIMEKLDFHDLKDFDPETILCKHFEHINKEKKELLSRLRRQERSVDHIERAKRKVEISFLTAKYDEEKISSQQIWDENEELRIENVVQDRLRVVKMKNKFFSMKSDLFIFIDKLKERKRKELGEEYSIFFQIIDIERERKLKERASFRKEQRRLAWLEDQKRKAKQRQEMERFRSSTHTINLKYKKYHVSQTKMSEGKESPKKETNRIHNNSKLNVSGNAAIEFRKYKKEEWSPSKPKKFFDQKTHTGYSKAEIKCRTNNDPNNQPDKVSHMYQIHQRSERSPCKDDGITFSRRNKTPYSPKENDLQSKRSKPHHENSEMLSSRRNETSGSPKKNGPHLTRARPPNEDAGMLAWRKSETLEHRKYNDPNFKIARSLNDRVVLPNRITIQKQHGMSDARNMFSEPCRSHEFDPAAFKQKRTAREDSTPEWRVEYQNKDTTRCGQTYDYENTKYDVRKSCTPWAAQLRKHNN